MLQVANANMLQFATGFGSVIYIHTCVQIWTLDIPLGSIDIEIS